MRIFLDANILFSAANPFGVSSGRGIAIREVPLKCGRSDYLLLVDREHLEADNVPGPNYKAFGEKLGPLIEELNLTLTA
jgi:hypothetical protein